MVLAKESLIEAVDMHEAARARAAEPHRGAAPGDLRQGERARHRRAGPRRADDRAGREDHGLPDARGVAAGRDHSELRGHASRALRARRLRPGAARSARRSSCGRSSPGSVAPARARQPRHADAARTSRRGSRARRLLLSGKMLTGRDAAHKRIAELLDAGKPLPEGVDFKNRFIYYVGPVDPVRDEVVGPAGPTTATRMDKFTEMMLAQTGLIAMIGKAERGPEAIEAIKQAQGRVPDGRRRRGVPGVEGDPRRRVVAFGDLGMEAIYEFEVKDMPVTVAVDARGESVHETGPAEWRGRIKGIPGQDGGDYDARLQHPAAANGVGVPHRLRLAAHGLGSARRAALATHPSAAGCDVEADERDAAERAVRRSLSQSVRSAGAVLRAVRLSRDHAADDAVPAGMRVGLRRATCGARLHPPDAATRSCGAFRRSSRARSCCT